MSEQQQRSISSLHLRDGGGGRAVKYRVLVFHLDRYGCRCRCYVSVRVVVVVVFVSVPSFIVSLLRTILWDEEQPNNRNTTKIATILPTLTSKHGES